MHWIDPECLPEFTGKIERFIVNPHGEIDGLLLTLTGEAPLLVHTPPHMGADITAAMAVGDKISVRGVRPRGADMIAAVALTAKGGKSVVDHGPDHDHKHKHHHGRGHPEPADAEGTVRLSLFGPKGELRGALLNDGTIVRIGPKEARHFAKLLQPGAAIAVRGEGLTTKHGRVIAVEEVRTGNRRPSKASKKDKPKHKGERAAAGA